MRGLALLALLPAAAYALDNGVGLTPPLGWRSYNAFGGVPTQEIMENQMKWLADKSRMVDGVPTSLLELGYDRIGLDGGWNQCFPENKTFHWASDGTPQWNSAFPDPQGMVDKAHKLGLKPGWYLNNCGCAEHDLPAAEVDQVMRASVKMLVDQGWDGVKFDSCSMYYNQTKWAALINESSKKPVMIENCHQGAYTPGMGQWQGYTKNSTTSTYDHFLGMFFGLPLPGTEGPGNAILEKVTFDECKQNCTASGKDCDGFTFLSDEVEPKGTISKCYVQKGARRNNQDMSQVNYCSGDTSPSDCPFNIYRVSGDISASFGAMVTNLAYTLPFLGLGGMHPPFPQDAVVRSRPGGWAYPDMLEVGNLVNTTEDRTHFGAWAIMSSPLILSFDMNDTAKMDRVWPIITNKALIAVNQRWVGNPGRRVSLSAGAQQQQHQQQQQQPGHLLNGEDHKRPPTTPALPLQVWAKPLGAKTYAVFLMNTGRVPIAASLPMTNVSAAFNDGDTCIRDLYAGKALPSLKAGAALKTLLPVHDSAMYCAYPSTAKGTCDGPAAKDCP